MDVILVRDELDLNTYMEIRTGKRSDGVQTTTKSKEEDQQKSRSEKIRLLQDM